MDTGDFLGFNVAIRDHGIAWFQFNTPERLNGMTASIKRDLVEAITQAQMDNAVRIVVFTGSGRAFCAGDDLKGYKYFLVEVSGYFNGIYSKVDDQILTLPLKIINDVSAVNEIRVDQYPFLTYGDFSIKINRLENLGSDNLLDEAREFYNLIERTLSAAQLKDYEVYLALADSAFAHCGRNPTSSLLFIQPGTVSSL